MIISPLNDHECLGAITDVVRTLVEQKEPELFALARELGSCGAAIRWMRSLPQRDDLGETGDGPRVEVCAPPQRLRLPAPDPNCVERAALYLVLGEILDAKASRRLATIDTPLGRHTLPVENGESVVLDPRVPRNCAQSGIDILGATRAPNDVPSCANWVCDVAREPAQQLPGGARRLDKARTALVATAQGIPVCHSTMEDVAMVLALAAREASRWGPRGVAVIDRVANNVRTLQRRTCTTLPASSNTGTSPRNRLELSIGRYRLRPAIPQALSAAVRTIGGVGLQAGTILARTQLAAVGVSPAMLSALESELNKDGLTIGALAKPTPPPYSFASLTSDALVARHLERSNSAQPTAGSSLSS